jgi:hypothetical protein
MAKGELICFVQIQKSKSLYKATIPARGVLMLGNQASAMVKLHDKISMISVKFSEIFEFRPIW